jgi:hypothetical protein
MANRPRRLGVAARDGVLTARRPRFTSLSLLQAQIAEGLSSEQLGGMRDEDQGLLKEPDCSCRPVTPFRAAGMMPTNSLTIVTHAVSRINDDERRGKSGIGRRVAGPCHLPAVAGKAWSIS